MPTSTAEVKGQPSFYEQHNIGKVRYVVNYHDGAKKHPDGSSFYDIATFSNKKKLAKFIRSLQDKGYVERSFRPFC